MIKSLQFCKLIRHNGENAEEWMGRIQLAAIECNYKQLDRQLKEQFIHGVDDAEMLKETIKELTKYMKMKMSPVKMCYPGHRGSRHKKPNLPL